jgi:hypothetical protein
MATAVAKHLARHPKVTNIVFPGAMCWEARSTRRSRQPECVATGIWKKERP